MGLKEIFTNFFPLSKTFDRSLHALWLLSKYWMSKYCENIACLFSFYSTTHEKPSQKKITKQRKHFKPSLSIETYRKKSFRSTSLSFHSPRTVAAFLRARCILPSPCVFKTLKKRKKETVLTTAQAWAAVESTRRTKEEFIIVMFIFWSKSFLCCL